MDPDDLSELMPHSEREVISAAVDLLKFYDLILGGRLGTNDLMRRWLIRRGTEIIEQKS